MFNKTSCTFALAKKQEGHITFISNQLFFFSTLFSVLQSLALKMGIVAQDKSPDGLANLDPKSVNENSIRDSPLSGFFSFYLGYKSSLNGFSSKYRRVTYGV